MKRLARRHQRTQFRRGGRWR